MKHTFLFCLLLVLMLGPQDSQAQRRGGRRAKPLTKGMTYGFKLGGAFSTLGGTGTKAAGFEVPGLDVAVEYKWKTGLVAGGLLNYRFSPEGSIQFELLYANRGFERVFTVGSTANDPEIVKANYVDIPVLFKGNMKVFYGEVGVVGSVLTSGKITQNKKEVAVGLSEQMNAYDVGGAIGAGVEAPGGVIFGLRYIRGFVDVGKNSDPPLRLKRTVGLNNSSVQVTAGYIFNHQSGRRRR